MKIQAYGIHDQFSLSEWKNESLTLLSNNGQTLAIDCPWHTLKSLHKDTSIISHSTHTKIDNVFISHTDSDHIWWIAQLLWMKKFWEGQKLKLITHPNIFNNLWKILEHSGFWQDRTSNTLSPMDPHEYIDFLELDYGDELILPGFWKVRSFYRSTKHCPGMDVIAIQVFDNDGENIANFSTDTPYDNELIDFLYESPWKVIHEAWSYTFESSSHTDINQLLLWVKAKDHNRTFINHLPELREKEILQTIQDSESSIRLADNITQHTRQKTISVLQYGEVVFPWSFDPWTFGHMQIVLDYLKTHPYSIVDIVIAINPQKEYLFNPKQRKKLIEDSFPQEIRSKIKVNIYKGVIADYIYENKKSCILKWIRNSKDFDYEMEIARASANFSWKPINVFIPQVDDKKTSVSSSMLKELMRLLEKYLTLLLLISEKLYE